MSLKEAIEEAIDELQEDIPFLTPGQLELLRTYCRLWEIEQKQSLMEKKKAPCGANSSTLAGHASLLKPKQDKGK